MSQANIPLRILFVTPVTPFSQASGSEQRSALMLSALQELAVVDVLILRQGKVTEIKTHHSESQRFVEATLSGSDYSFMRFKPKPVFTKNIEDAMGGNLKDYQAIVGRYVWPICQLAAPAHVPLIVDLDDFKFRYSEFYPLSWRSYTVSIIKSISHKWMGRQLGRFDLTFIVTHQDRQLTQPLTQILLPNVPLKINEQLKDYPLNGKVLFVGSLWYEPNYTGVNWFLDNVWPVVKAVNSDAELILVGAAPKWKLDKWSELPGVTATGFANSIDIFYEEANVVVVPILSGGGSSIKVLEALAQGRPCVVTDFVAEAYRNQLTADQDYLVAGNAGEFIEKIQYCLKKNEVVESIASKGHAIIINKFSPDVFRSTVINAVTGAIESKLMDDNTKLN